MGDGKKKSIIPIPLKVQIASGFPSIDLLLPPLRLHVGLFSSAHHWPTLSPFGACFLFFEPFRALMPSVKQSALSYNNNSDITALQRRTTSLIWRLFSNEFRVISEKREKCIVDLQTLYMCGCASARLLWPQGHGRFSARHQPSCCVS